MLTKNSLRFICGVCIAALIFSSPVFARPFFGRTIQLPIQKISPGQGQITLSFSVPVNHHFATEAPSTIFARVKDPSLLKVNHSKPQVLDLSKLPYSLSYQAMPGETVLVIDTRVHFCDEETQLCLSDSVRIKLPIKIEAGAPSVTPLNIPIRSKKSQ